MKVILIVALSADGFIAKDSDHFADWTSKEDKKLFVDLTRESGVVIMGRNTFETIGKALPGRLNMVYTSKKLADKNIEATAEEPTLLLNRLAERGFNKVAVCGGQSIYDLFLKENLVDELYITVEPKLFGNGITLSKSFSDTELKLIELKKLNNDTLNLHYKVIK